MHTTDRFEIERDSSNRIAKGWRITRYSFGRCTIQHLRTGRSNTGVIDDFGNVVDTAQPSWIHGPGETHNGYHS